MEEQQLIQQILHGDRESFRFLYRLHAHAAWQLAFSICKNKNIAEEAVQNAFMSAFQYLHTFRQESSFKTWLLRIVFNESIRMQKLERKYQWQDIVTNEYGEENLQVTASSSLHKKETKEQVESILSKLNEKEALVLHLFYLEEMSIKEIVEIVGYTESNVKVILHRARKNFKFEYEKI